MGNKDNGHEVSTQDPTPHNTLSLEHVRKGWVTGSL